jgi:hypothetical protein
MLIATGCRKGDEIIPTRDSSVFLSEVHEKNAAGRFDSYVAQSWYKLAFTLIIETPGHTPPVVARSM